MVLMIILGTVVIAAFFLYKHVVKSMNYWTDRGVHQGSPYSFLSDNRWMIFKDKNFPELVLDVYHRSPGKRYCGAYIFFVPTLVIRDLDLIKQITVKDFDSFSDHKGFVDPDIEPLLGKNLVTLSGQKWREMRNILSPSFTSSKMKSMFVFMTECAENFVDHFIKKEEAIIELEIKDAFTCFTNDVIATTAFGIKVDSLEEPNNEFYRMGKEAMNTGFWKMIKFLGYMVMPRIFKRFKLRLFSKELSGFFQNVVDETIKTREEKGIVRPDMIHLLMEARKGNGHSQEETDIIDTGFATATDSNLVSGKEKHSTEITNEDIAGHALVFFFAGFDTVSALLCFSSYELAVNLDIQERLRKEIQATYSQCRGKLTYEALLKMKYLDMFISETLRKWPNAPATDRICTKPYTIEPTIPGEKPLHVDKGTLIWLPTWAIHHDPEYYPDPERFDPERFNDENKGNIKSYTYFPFGLGPRNCIGSRFALLEAKVLLFHVLLHFEIVPVKRTKIPLTIDRNALGMQAEGGFWFGLKRINQ